jgi:nitrilase
VTKLDIIRSAAIQAEPVILDRDGTVAKACELIAEAARNGARLIVFPELFIPIFPNSSIWGRGMALWGSDKARAAWLRLWENAIEIGDESTRRLCTAAREAGSVVVIGLNEREARTRTLYNTLLFIGEDGTILGKHRKLLPTNAERMLYGSGDGSTLRVFDTSVGRIGGLICWENLMPLARYALYAQGEQIHAAPTAWEDEMALVNARNTAFEGGVFVISVSMILRTSSFPSNFEFRDELEQAGEYPLPGGSFIVSPDGRVLAGPLWKEEGILYADLDLRDTVRASQLLDSVGHYARREVFELKINRSSHAAACFAPETA